MTEDQQRHELQQLARILNDPADPDAASRLARAMRDDGEAPIVVSACLLGAPTRHDGGDRRTETVARAVAERRVLPLCPELLAGLGCPRPAIHFARGDGDDVVPESDADQDPGALPPLDTGPVAVDDQGVDRGPALLAGARRALALAQEAGAHEAILKERSPSCGCHEVHTAVGVAEGRGVFAALASRAGFTCRSDEDLGPPHSRR